MPKFIENPAIVESAGNLPKKIEEFVGRVNTGDSQISIARMTSPEGWEEPGQRPEFQEITVVLEGTIVVEFEGGTREVNAGSAIVAEPGEWVRYRTPKPGGAHYIAICLPAFSPDIVHRDF
ncbi:MAG TPA: cupin domain-containing protein [Oscillatoriales cyanobacterium M59_W2019_021]|nr:cupin domain-containing protein [Oscillatoriales cyanobacterium M4454_W2019_049]HIK51351.1 cupin domain-containing protein [Oscillatoriales cyanobacterium M59_W2019_021]